MTKSRLANEREETFKLLSMMVPYTLGNIITRLESENIIGMENLAFCT
jgi:hypothetical protein